VLWLVTILASVSVAALALTRNTALFSKTAEAELQAEGLADAAVYLAINDLCNPATRGAVPVAGQKRTMRIAEHEVAVSVQDELGKIDINRAPVEFIASLLSQHGLADSEADKAIAHIEERRAALNGAARSGIEPFRSLEDLRDVQGVTTEVYERIEPAVTLYSQSAAVSPALAPVEVLRVLPGFDEQKIEEVLSARAAESETPAANVTGQTSLEGHAFTIKAAARIGRNLFVRHAVVRITGSFQKPYDILRWVSADASGM
jgi:general secretion pathway protein K